METTPDERRQRVFDFLDGQAEPKHFKGTWTGELEIF